MILYLFSLDKMIEILIYSACFVVTVMWFLGWNTKKKQVINEATDIRYLGNKEQIYLNKGRKGGQHIVCTIIFASVKPINLKNVEKALCHSVKIHPLLRMKVNSTCDKNTNDRFVRIDEMKIKLEELPNKIWLNVMEKQLYESGINREEGPLWHVKFLPNINTEDTHIVFHHQCALIFVFDHAIFDGGASLQLINDTLTFLESEVNDIENSEYIDSLPLPKSLCDITGIERKLPLSLNCLKLLIRYVPSTLIMIAKIMKYDDCVIENIPKKSSFVRTTPPATSLIPMAFNKKETKSIMKSCKEHSVSPLAAFQAAMITILLEKQFVSEEVIFTTTVDLRPYYPECKTNNKYQQVANYSSFVPSKIKIPEENTKSSFWTLAQSCKHAVHDNLLSRIIYNLQLFLIMSKCPFEPQKKMSPITFSNFGNCSFFDRKDHCSVRLIGFQSCASMFEDFMPLFSTHCIYFENRLLWNLTYSPDGINRETAAEIAEAMKKTLLAWEDHTPSVHTNHTDMNS